MTSAPAQAPPQVSVELPPGFTVLDLVGEEVGGEPQAPSVFDGAAETARSFAGLDVGLSAVGVHALPGGGYGHTWLTLACPPLDVPDAVVAADGIALSLRAEHVDVHRIRLPAGEAVSVVSFLRRPVQVDDAEPIDLDTGQLQVHLPMAGYDRVLVLTVESVALEAWVDVCATAAEIARSLRWEGDASDADGAGTDSSTPARDEPAGP